MFPDLGGILYIDKQLIFEILLQLFNTAVMCLIIAKLVYIPVKDFLHKRTERVESTLQSADMSLTRANDLKLEYETKMKEVDAERVTILEAARKRGKEAEEEILKEAKQEATATKERAFLDIDREKRKAKDEMKTEIIQISSLMANKIIQANMNEEVQNKILEESIDELGDVQWLK